MSEKPKRKYRATLYVADERMNNILSSVDLRPDYKWFVEANETTFETTTEVDENYFLNVINESKKVGDGFWIPAIGWNGSILHHPSVKILSDGKTERFL